MCLNSIDRKLTDFYKNNFDPDYEIICYKTYKPLRKGKYRSGGGYKDYKSINPNKLIVSDRKNQLNMSENMLSQDEISSNRVNYGIHAYAKSSKCKLDYPGKLFKCSGKVKDLIAVGLHGNTEINFVFNKLRINVK